MNLTAFISGTIFIMLFSWFLSIRHKRYHGIPRFFAFESIFVIVLLNAGKWFSDPLSWNQILSWILLTSSVYPVVTGYILLKRKGKPGKNFENTSLLVRSGIYSIIRHPLYLSVFLFGAGAMLKNPGTIQLILGAVTLVSIYFTALVEEGEMIAKFGDEYRQYMKETRMFIPYII